MLSNWIQELNTMILSLLYMTVFRFVFVDQFHANDLFHQFCEHICWHKLLHYDYLRLSRHSPVTNMYAIYCFVLGMFTKSMPSKVKLQLKGGAAVDPDSNLVDVAHVYKNKHDIYNAVLGVTDIQSGKNSYYKLQVLESDAGNRCVKYLLHVLIEYS